MANKIQKVANKSQKLANKFKSMANKNVTAKLHAKQFVTADKEDNPMTTIINFLQHHNEKQEREIQKLFQKANSLDDKLDALIQQKHLQIQDHKLFLAFLAHLEQQQIPAQQLFKDVLQLPKHQFEARYNMKWVQVVTLSVTFLTILRTNEPESYKQFMR